MDEITKQVAIARIVDECIKEFKSRWFDLGTILGRVAHRCQIRDEAEIVRLSLDAVRLLVARGFRAAAPGELGYRFWPERDADSIVARIARKVDEIEVGRHRLLSIGDVCHLGTVEMGKAAKQARVAELARDYCADKGKDQSELGDIASSIRWTCGIESNEEVKRLTLELVRAIVGSGLRVGYFEFYGSHDFILWPEQDAASVVARIDREWDATRGDPTLVDPICWFE